jgi:hypothetical protein
MEIWIPRDKNHFIAAYDFSATIMQGSPSDDLAPFGISRSTDGCGSCTGTAMNSVAVNAVNGGWRAVDGVSDKLCGERLFFAAIKTCLLCI